jgi:hypothetical protein
MDKRFVAILLVLSLSASFFLAEVVVYLPSPGQESTPTEFEEGQSMIYYLKVLNKQLVGTGVVEDKGDIPVEVVEDNGKVIGEKTTCAVDADCGDFEGKLSENLSIATLNSEKVFKITFDKKKDLIGQKVWVDLDDYKIDKTIGMTTTKNLVPHGKYTFEVVSVSKDKRFLFLTIANKSSELLDCQNIFDWDRVKSTGITILQSYKESFWTSLALDLQTLGNNSAWKLLGVEAAFRKSIAFDLHASESFSRDCDLESDLSDGVIVKNAILKINIKAYESTDDELMVFFNMTPLKSRVSNADKYYSTLPN